MLKLERTQIAIFFLVLCRFLCMSYWIWFYGLRWAMRNGKQAKKSKESVSLQQDSNQQPFAPKLAPYLNQICMTTYILVVTRGGEFVRLTFYFHDWPQYYKSASPARQISIGNVTQSDNPVAHITAKWQLLPNTSTKCNSYIKINLINALIHEIQKYIRISLTCNHYFIA